MSGERQEWILHACKSPTAEQFPQYNRQMINVLFYLLLLNTNLSSWSNINLIYEKFLFKPPFSGKG